MREAINFAGELAGLAIMPAIGGMLFAVFGHSLHEAATAPGSSPFRQYAHYWVAGMIVWAIASGKLAGAASDYGW